MTDDISLDEYRAIKFQRGLLKPEKSWATYQYLYGSGGDPANHVRLPSEINCKGCVYSRPGKAGQFCSKGRVHGVKCRDFKGRK
jgi:hypothetical protein